MYLRITRELPDLIDLPSTPEFQTTFAIEKFILAEDPSKLSIPDVKVLVTSLAMPSQTNDCLTLPIQSFLASSRNTSRIAALRLQYPSFSTKQLTDLFTLFWSEDFDLVCFYECPDSKIHGHLTISGLNLSLEPPLPLAGWLSGIESKTLAGRALFERTFQERKELISSLLKSKMSESSPVRVMITFAPISTLVDGFAVVPVTVRICNTSWMHLANYEFEVVDRRYPRILIKCHFAGG